MMIFFHIKRVQGCGEKSTAQYNFNLFFHVSSPGYPLHHLSFSWSITDHPRELLRFQLPTCVENVKFKVNLVVPFSLSLFPKYLTYCGKVQLIWPLKMRI